MNSVFVDTAYHVALLDRRDDLRRRALSVGTELKSAGASFVTSDAVVIEVLNYFSKWGQPARLAAVGYLSELRVSGVVMIPLSAALIEKALDLYARRPDKSYSMTDCISMVICRDRGIKDVLSGDSDFVREGLNALLRR